MGYTGFRRKFFVTLLPPWAFESAGRKDGGEAMRKHRRVHRASLTQVLILCNQLTALIALAVGLFKVGRIEGAIR